MHNPSVGGYVSLTFLDENDKLDQSLDFDEEIDKNDHYCIATVQKIEEIISKGYHYKDIAILTRKRSQGILIANYLTKQNIPLISSETLTYISIFLSSINFFNYSYSPSNFFLLLSFYCSKSNLDCS